MAAGFGSVPGWAGSSQANPGECHTRHPSVENAAPGDGGALEDRCLPSSAEVSVTLSPHATPGDSTDAEATALRRTLALTQVHDWCLERLSELSLAGQMPQARALTAEHLELLEVVSQRHTLWMVTEAEG